MWEAKDQEYWQQFVNQRGKQSEAEREIHRLSLKWAGWFLLDPLTKLRVSLLHTALKQKQLER